MLRHGVDGLEGALRILGLFADAAHCIVGASVLIVGNLGATRGHTRTDVRVVKDNGRQAV